MNLNQVTLPAIDLDASVRFYETLGLRLIVHAPPRYARFECPDGTSTLSVELATAAAGSPGAVIYLECADVDAEYLRLRRAGVSFASTPTDEPWLWREVRLTDPAGNPLCLYAAGENRRNPPWRLRS